MARGVARRRSAGARASTRTAGAGTEPGRGARRGHEGHGGPRRGTGARTGPEARRRPPPPPAGERRPPPGRPGGAAAPGVGGQDPQRRRGKPRRHGRGPDLRLQRPGGRLAHHRPHGPPALVPQLGPPAGRHPLRRRGRALLQRRPGDGAGAVRPGDRGLAPGRSHGGAPAVPLHRPAAAGRPGLGGRDGRRDADGGVQPGLPRRRPSSGALRRAAERGLRAGLPRTHGRRRRCGGGLLHPPLLGDTRFQYGAALTSPWASPSPAPRRSRSPPRTARTSPRPATTCSSSGMGPGSRPSPPSCSWWPSRRTRGRACRRSWTRAAWW